MKNDDLRLVLRAFDEELDQIDRSKLETLLAESPGARDEQVRIRRMRDLVSNNAAASFAPGFADNVLRQVAATQASQEPSELSGWFDRMASAVLTFRFATGMAAAVAVAIALGVVTWLQPRTVEVPNGETRTISLADGSAVELSGGSSATYHYVWGRAERRVALDGEAFFDVAESEKPFVVETFNASVEVLGTEFNVKAWRDDPRAATEVAVASGRVAVLPSKTRSARAANDAPAVLEPGEAASVTSDSVTALPGLSLDHVTAWRSGGLAFRDQPLGSVFRTFERRFGVNVRVAERDINDRLLTYLNPRPQSASAVLADICHTLDLRYRRTSDGFEVLSAANH